MAIDKKDSTTVAFVGAGPGLTYYALKEPVKYTTGLYPDIDKQNLMQELLYNGKLGNTLKFTYREYVNDIAKPAFMQELQYDMSESNIIGIKGLRIEVLNTTNTKIEYRIISNFN